MVTIAQCYPHALRQVRGGDGQAVPGRRDLDGVLRHLVGGILGLPGELFTERLQLRLESSLLRLQMDPAGAPDPQQAHEIFPALGKEVFLLLRERQDQTGILLVIQVVRDAQLPVGAYGVGRLPVQQLPLRRGYTVPGLIGQRQIERHGLLRDFLPQPLRRLLRREPRRIHAVDGGVGVKDIQGICVGAQRRIGGKQHRRKDPYDDQRLFAAGFQPLRRGGFVRVRFHEALLLFRLYASGAGHAALAYAFRLLF